MQIDLTTETLITLGEACRAVPPTGVSAATMARWIQRGVRGTRLETVLLGGRRLTSREALVRFFNSQNTAESPEPPPISPTQRRKQAETANRLLQEAGA
ncbi:MAG: hypothetical protein JWP89_2731 [Schlesneria sp.]|nr:hypothetical protein [Schlesneria sp.]